MARKRITENSVVVSTGAAAAPVRRKPSTTNRTTRTTRTSGTAELTFPAPVAPVAQVLSRTVPTYQEIASLAYSYWEARGHQGGSPEEDWFRAERELSAQ